MADVFGQVDICFVIDTTSSMQPYIDEARARARAEAERVAASADLDIRVAVVEYRDHPPQEHSFVFRVHDFVPLADLNRYLDGLRPVGGGDFPEAVFDGVVAAGNLPWRDQADRLVFLIGDAPPHGYRTVGDGFPDGCPCHLTVAGIGELYSHNRIRLYSIGLTTVTTGPFTELAEACGGHHTQVEAVRESTVSMGTTMAATGDLVRMSRAYAMSVSALGPDAGTEAYATHMTATTGMHVNSATVGGIASYTAARGIDVTSIHSVGEEVMDVGKKKPKGKPKGGK